MTLEVDVTSIKDKIVTVARNFPPSMRAGSKLRQMLESWLGSEFFQQNSGRKIDFDSLMDRKANILVHLIPNPGYAQPYRFLAGMYPLGTLPLTEGKGSRGWSVSTKRSRPVEEFSLLNKLASNLGKGLNESQKL